MWVVARGDGEFRRAKGGWVHELRAGAWREFPVPGARDVTLEELHGHRILDPRSDPTLENRQWSLRGDPLHIRLRDAQQFAELRGRERRIGSAIGPSEPSASFPPSSGRGGG